MSDIEQKNESEKEESGSPSSVFDTILNVIIVALAFVVGRFFGLLGIGAVGIGWLVFNQAKEKLGNFVAICAGGVAGLVCYGIAVMTLLGN